jgi:O-antigen ligase
MMYPPWFLFALLSGRLSKLRFGAADYFFMAFILWIMVTLVANSSAYNFKPIIIDRYLKWFVLYLLIRATVRTPDELRRVVAFTVFLVFVLVVEGIQHKLSPDGLNWAGQPLGWVEPSVLAAGGSGRTKWVGVFDGIGVFCVVYTIALPFVLNYCSDSFSKPIRWLNRAALPFLFVAIYFTGSRGGLLTTLAVISLHLAMKYKISIKTIIIGASVVSLTLALAPSYLTETHDSSNSAQNRIDVWGQGLGMLSDNPIFGVGAGNFLNHTRTIIAHNSGVQIAAEMGFLGLFLWMSTIACCLRAALLRMRATQSIAEKNVLLGCMLAVMGYIVSSMFVTLEYETFYMLLALCVGNYERAVHGPAYRGRELRLSAVGVVAFLIVIKAVVTTY